MGEMLSVCERPLRLCQMGEEETEGRYALRVKMDNGQVLSFTVMKSYHSPALQARYNISKRRSMEKNQGRARHKSPPRETTSLRGETRTRADLDTRGGKMHTQWEDQATEYQGNGVREDIWSLYPWKDYRFQPKHTWIVNTAETRISYLFSLSNNVDDRVMENVQDDLKDIATCQSYAHRFNTQFQSGQNTNFAGVERCAIQVVRSHAAEVVDTTFTALIRPGDVGVITPLPHHFAAYEDVEKFLFDGSEPYCEIAQTFFHYVFFMSGGKEMVTDMQGVLTEDCMLLYDPVVLRSGTLTGGVGATGKLDSDGVNSLFRKLCPRTTSTAKTFDPDRQAHSRKQVCGITCSLY